MPVIALHTKLERLIKLKLTFCDDVGSGEKEKKPLELRKKFLQKILTRAIFLLAPPANILGTSQFFNVCMKLQHAVILEST